MAGLDAFGTRLRRSNGSGFATVARVTSIDGPGIERETLDLSAHDTPDGWMEFGGGLVDAGEIEVELNYDPTEHDALVADLDDEPRLWQLVFPDATSTTWSFYALLTEFSPEAPYDDRLVASVTWKLTGRPGFAEFAYPSTGTFPDSDLYPAAA